MRKNHKTTTRHQEDKKAKQPALFSPINMIARLDWTQGAAINNRTTALELTTAYQPLGGGGGGGGVNTFYWYQIFTLVSAVVVALKC